MKNIRTFDLDLELERPSVSFSVYYSHFGWVK